MSDLTYLFAIAGALAAVLASISIWSRRALAVKVLALTATVLFLPAAYASLTQLLGRPKPVTLEWVHRAADDATVISTQLVEGKGIYLWLRLPDVEEPMSYALPWSEQLARQLHGAQRQAQRNGTNVKSRKPFAKRSDESETVFYAEPQPEPPAKQAAQSPAPLVFKSSNHSASR